RLINMYSAKGDLVLDPFLCMGTTALAAMVSGRNSVGYEIDNTLQYANTRLKKAFIQTSQQIIRQRLLNHIDFVCQRIKSKKKLKYKNSHYGFPVITNQEKELLLNDPVDMENVDENLIRVNYSTQPQQEFCKDWSDLLSQKNMDNFSIRHFKKSPDQQQSPF
ncbi:MAG: site-specific DNA-methyltransferase, partial [Desulfobacteraceae bacterium]|nr:site-specific DNA-methyltransferase [Desulfobacteraceae bacterium]